MLWIPQVLGKCDRIGNPVSRDLEGPATLVFPGTPLLGRVVVTFIPQAATDVPRRPPSFE